MLYIFCKYTNNSLFTMHNSQFFINFACKNVEKANKTQNQSSSTYLRNFSFGLTFIFCISLVLVKENCSIRSVRLPFIVTSPEASAPSLWISATMFLSVIFLYFTFLTSAFTLPMGSFPSFSLRISLVRSFEMSMLNEAEQSISPSLFN